MTEAERFVWSKLRLKQFHGFRFRRQSLIGPFIVDFVCHEAKVVIELDGGQHADRRDYDGKRDRWLQDEGFLVCRYWNHDVLTDWDTIEEHLFGILFSRSPHPPLRGDLPHKGGGENSPEKNGVVHQAEK